MNEILGVEVLMFVLGIYFIYKINEYCEVE